MSENLLEAGAILPSSAKLKGKVLDVLEARHYVHAALAEPMVRFSAANVAHALDLEMDLLGFDVPKKGKQLGKVRREKLGFPAWALVHDEKNARYALDVVKDLKKAIRRMKSKPGFAKEQIDEIAETLAGSVPHFLPSFFEEAARAFIDHDNRSYAQQYFEKARAAERTYALEVDDELREESFVAFALAGALSVKSLSNFAAELGERGKAGLESYSRVCIRRTVGGQPPSAATLKDLKGLAKAAGEDPLEAQVHFLEGVLESPALRSAPAGFFKSAKKPLQTLLKDAPEKRALLLDLFPHAVKQKDWIPILKSCGALDALADAELDGQSQLSTAAWFSRTFKKGADKELLALLEQCAPRLLKEGEAIIPGHGWGLHVDVVELGLRLGLKLNAKRKSDYDDGDGDEDDALHFHDLEDWAPEFEGDDLTAIAADDVFRKHFVNACSQLSGYDYASIVPALDGRDALMGMVEAGLERRIAKMKSGGLPALGDNFSFMSDVPDDMWELFPQLGEALRKTDVAASLAKTLQIGFFDELHWPKYEELRDGKLKGSYRTIFKELPFVVFYTEKRIVVLDGDDNEVFDYKPKMEKGHSIQTAIYVGDDLFVVTGTWSAKTGYWVSNPKEPIAFKSFYHDSAIRMPDGSVLFGTHRFRKGDQRLEPHGQSFFDGEKYYTWKDGGPHAFDPETGKLAEKGLPEFLTRPKADTKADTKDASKGDDDNRTYSGFITALELPEDALIRSKNGQIGMRWVEEEGDDEDRTLNTVEDIVGPVGTYRGWRDISAAYIAPASDEMRLLVASYGDIELLDVHGVAGLSDESEYQHGKTAFFSMPLLKRYKPRDLKTSARLRAMTVDSVAPLLAAASTKTARKVELDDDKLKPNAGVVSALEEAFPELSAKPLRDAVAGVVHLAGRMVHKREELIAKVPEASPDGAKRKRVSLPKRKVGDARLPVALGAFAWPFTYSDPKKPTMVSELAELRARFQLLPSSGQLQWGPHIWQLGLGHGSAILYRYACCPKKKKADRTHIETWVRALAAAGFEGEGADKVRMAYRKQNTLKINQDSQAPTWKVLGDNGVFCWQLGYGKEAHYTFIEHAPSGEFQVVTNAKDDISGPGWATPENIDAVVAKVEKDGPLPIAEAAAIVSEKTGLSPAEAALWCVAELDGDTWGVSKKGKKAALDMFDNNPFMKPWPTHQKDQLALATGVWMAGPWEELWDAEVLAERICEQFFLRHPELPALTKDDDLANEALVKIMPSVSWIARAGLPSKKPLVVPALHKDKDRWFEKEDYNEEGEGFEDLEPFMKGLSLALYTAPLRSGIVRSLSTVWQEVQKRLMHPTYFEYIYTDMFYTEDPDADDADEVKSNDEAKAFLDQFPSTAPKELWRGPRKPKKNTPYSLPRGDGKVMVRGGGWEVSVWVHPSAVLEGDARLETKGVGNALNGLRLNFEFALGDAGKSYIALAEKLAGKEGCAGDPRVSAPKAVKSAAKKLGVSEDAAALYLMLAALPHPSDANVQKITGWTKKARQALAEELVKKKHVLSAKRAGAGRSEFVPGAWVSRGVPRAIEEWKRAHLGWADKATAFGGDVIPLAPDQLYTSIWKRIDAGDGPGFEDPPKRAKKTKKKS